MPIYEYACRSCGQHLEVAQSFVDDPLTTCPACEGPLRKVYGSIGITFKGSGFYRTDSRGASTNGAKADKADKADKAETGEKAGAGKADTAGAKSDAGSKSEGSSSAGDKGSSAAKGSKAPKAPNAKAASA